MITKVLWWIFWLSVIYFVCINVLYTFLLILSIIQNRIRALQTRFEDMTQFVSSSYTMPVSIVIPAFNEETVIVDNVYSCLKLNYPEFEVIVINDGSSDSTLHKMIKEFDLYPLDIIYRNQIKTGLITNTYASKKYDNLILVDKPNSGKADSLNIGVNFAKYPYVCSTDADSLFEPDALLRAMRLVVEDPERIVGVSGQVMIRNGITIDKGKIIKRGLPKNWIALFQFVEYTRTFLAHRLGWSWIGSLLVVSGAFGIWRRDILIELGGFSSETVCEDIELTFRCHSALRGKRTDYKIISIPDPVCWTEGPQSLKNLAAQRNRWQRVVLETVLRNMKMMLNPVYGSVGMIGMPYYIFYEILGPFIEVLGYLMLIFGVLYGYFKLDIFMLFLAFLVFYNASLAMISAIIQDYGYGIIKWKDVVKLIFASLAEYITYHTYLNFVRIKGTFDVFSQARRWHKFERLQVNRDNR